MLIDRADIEGAFRHLLGRTASAAEIEALLAHFGTPGVDNDQALHDSLLRSEEFRNRRIGVYQREQFNPLAYDRARLVFVHLEKCGGTTLRAMLETQFEPALICPERLDGLGNWTINELAAYDLFCGHFDLSVTRAIPGHVRRFTMLREPKARLISLFRFWKSHLPDTQRDGHNLMVLARDLGIEAFFGHPFVKAHPSIRDGMAGQLIRTGGKLDVDGGNILAANPAAAGALAWSHLQSLTAFGIMERFEESRRLLNTRLGLAMQPAQPRQVLTEMAVTDPQLVALPPTTMTPHLDALLVSLTMVDRALYARALKLFNRRVSGGLGHFARRIFGLRRG